MQIKKLFTILFLFLTSFHLYGIELSDQEKQWLSENKEITVRVASWPPYQIYENGKASGVSVDIAKDIFDKHNIRYRFVSYLDYPLKKAINSMKNKSELDMMLALKPTKERQEFMLFSEPYIAPPWVIFTRNNSPFIGKINNLFGKKVAVQQGVVMHKLLREHYPQIKLHVIKHANSTVEAMRTLATGKVDAFIGNLATGSYIINKYSFSGVKVAAPAPFGNHENSFAVRNDHPELLSILNKELALLTPEKKHAIVNKYVSVKYDHGWSLEDIFLWSLGLGFVFFIILIIQMKANEKIRLKNSQISELYQKLKETNEKLLGLYKLSPLGIALTDMEGNYLEFNESFEKISGYTKEELNKLDYWQLTPGKYKEQEEEQLKSLIETGFYGPYEKEYKQKNGNLIPINLNGMLITDKDGNQYIWSIVEDISSRKNTEQAMLQQSKMAAMGEMIANIAHQWRQPLSVVSTAATGMKIQKEMNMLQDQEFYELCDAIDTNSQYLSQTIDDFRNFIKGDTKPVTYNLKETIDSFLKLVNTTIKSENIQVILQLKQNTELNGFPSELIQCFINIFNNSKDAFKEHNIENTDRLIFISQNIDNDKVIITFKDTANGISNEIISKVFEPYFTTKHQSLGTGLGLHMTYDLIVNHMQGSIEIMNEDFEYNGKKYTGACFSIVLNMVQ